MQALRLLRNISRIPTAKKLNLFCAMTSTILENFFQAVENGDVTKVDDVLKSKQVTVEDRSEEYENGTALHVAAYEGQYHIAKLLVENYEANVNATNNKGKIPLELAVNNYNARVAKYLIKNKSDKPELANGLKNLEGIEELVEAAENNDIDQVSNIIESKKADVNAVDRGNFHGTILHIAARNGYLELVKDLVLRHNADINMTDDVGERPVDVAAINGNEDVVDFLVAYENKDYTPLAENGIANGKGPKVDNV